MPELEVTKLVVLPGSKKSSSKPVNIPVDFLLRRDDYTIEFRNSGFDNHYLYFQAKGPNGESLILRSPQVYGGLSDPPRRETYRYHIDAELHEVLELRVRDSTGRELGRESLKLVALSGGKCLVWNA